MCFITLSENEASLQKLPDKSQISGKRLWILLLKTEKKKKSKTLKTFQKLVEQISQSPSVPSQQAELSSRGNTYEEIDQKLHISGNTGRVKRYLFVL